MKQIPMLFSPDMIAALLDGRKTQTRRVLKPRSKNVPSLFNGSWSDTYIKLPGNASWVAQDIPIEVGDLIWAKESHYAWGQWEYTGETTKGGAMKKRFVRSTFTNGKVMHPVFRPGGHPVIEGQPIGVWGLHKRPSMFMFKDQSRLTLKVTDVRVQRVQDISAEDCEREGIRISDGALMRDGYMLANRKDFAALWNSIHGPDAWDQNPWVYASTFEVVEANVLKVAA